MSVAPHVLRSIAVTACVDPRTVKKYLVGGPVRSYATRLAIAKAARQHGLEAPEPSAASPEARVAS